MIGVGSDFRIVVMVFVVVVGLMFLFGMVLSFVVMCVVMYGVVNEVLFYIVKLLW